MSRFQTNLDLVIQVLEKNAQGIGRTITSLRQLQQAEQKGVQTTQQQTQATTAATVATSRRNRETERGLALKVREALQEAQLARQKGEFAAAERTVERAMRAGNLTVLQQTRLLSELVRIQNQASSAAVRNAVSQANLASRTGDTAGAIRTLQAAMQRNNLTLQQQERLHRALATAQRQQAAAAAQAAAANGAALGAGGGGLFGAGGGGFRGFFGSFSGGFAAGRGRTGDPGGVLGTLGAALGTVTRIFNIFTRILAASVLIGFTIRTVIRTVERFSFGPLRDVSREILTITDEFRRLQASLSGITGSMRATRDLTRDVARATGDLPVTLREGLSGVRGLAFVPGTAQQIQRDDPGRPERIERLLGILTRLATIDPDQGIEGARFAVREALAGEFRSLRFRFEISPDVVAASAGVTLEDLKRDPDLTLRALESFTNQFVGPEAINQFNSLLSVQANKLRGTLEEFFLAIGDAGFYDHIVQFIRNIGHNFQSALRGGRIESITTAVSARLTGLFEVLVDVADRIVSRIAAADVRLRRFDDTDIENVGRAFVRIIDGMAAFVESMTQLLPAMVAAMGPLVRVIADIVNRAGGLARDVDSLERDIEIAGGRGTVWVEMGRFLDVFTTFLSAGPDAAANAQARHSRAREREALGRLPEEQARRARETNPIDQFMRDFRRRFEALQLQQAIDRGGPGGGIGGITTRLNLGVQQFGLNAQRLDSFEALDREVVTLRQNFAEVNRAFAEAISGRRGVFGVRRAPAAELAAIEAGDEATIDTVVTREIGALPPSHPVRRAFDSGVLSSMDALTFAVQTLEREIREQRLFEEARRVQGPAAQNLVDQALAGVLEAQAKELSGLPPATVARRVDSILSQTGRFAAGANLPDVGPFLPGQGPRGANPFATRAGAAALLGSIEAGATARFETGGGLAAFDQGLTQLEQMQELFRSISGDLTPELRQDIEETFQHYAQRIRQARDEADPFVREWKQAANDIAEVFKTGFGDALVDVFDNSARNIKEIARDMFVAVRRIVIDMILELTIISSLRNALSGAFGAGATPGAPLPGTIGPQPIRGRTGVVLSPYMVRPMQFGGRIATGPQILPLGGGRSALIGEAGEEAVLPLLQDGRGNLGVRAVGGGGGPRIINQTWNIVTPDADSMRLSRRQIQREQRRTAQMG